MTMDTAPRATRRQLVPFAALSASYFAHIGFFNPYLPLWLKHLGLSHDTLVIAVIVGCGTETPTARRAHPSTQCLEPLELACGQQLLSDLNECLEIRIICCNDTPIDQTYKKIQTSS